MTGSEKLELRAVFLQTPTSRQLNLVWSNGVFCRSIEHPLDASFALAQYNDGKLSLTREQKDFILKRIIR